VKVVATEVGSEGASEGAHDQDRELQVGEIYVVPSRAGFVILLSVCYLGTR
jgi:hypothetical protein